MLTLTCESKQPTQNVVQPEEQCNQSIYNDCEYLSILFDQIDETNNIKDVYEEIRKHNRVG